MRIAVAAEGKNVTGHFGHCVNFMLYDVEGNQITKEEFVNNPGHKPGFLPNFLADRGVKVIISGGMGQGAVDIFNERDVEVVTGASGDAKTAVERYLRETGNTKLSLPAIIAMANAVDASVDELLCDNVKYSKHVFIKQANDVFEDFDDYEVKVLVRVLKATKAEFREDAAFRAKME